MDPYEVNEDEEETDWNGHPRDSCYFCRDDCDVLETHHIVPRRHGGGDEDYNLVDLCPTCHEKLERLYDKRFYQAVGVGDPDEIVGYVTEFLISELDRLELDMGRRLYDARSRLEATHIDGETGGYRLSDQIETAVRDYYAEPDPDQTDKEQEDVVKDAIERIEDEELGDHHGGAEQQLVIEHAERMGLSESEVRDCLEALKHRGEVYELNKGYFRTT